MPSRTGRSSRHCPTAPSASTSCASHRSSTRTSSPQTTKVNLTGLAALSATNAIAIDSNNRTWRLTRANGLNEWVEEGALSAPVDAVAAVNGGPSPWNSAGWVTEFLAGGEAGAGAIWHSTRWTKDATAWKRDTLPAGTPELNGIAATRWNAAWAVGAGGTILHLWRPPDPEAEAAWRAAEEQRRLEEQQQQEQQQQQQDPGTGTQDQTQAQQEQTTVVSLRQWQPSGSSTPESGDDRLVTNGVVVTDGDRTSPTRTRLVKNVRAVFRPTRTGRRLLIVRFRLTRRAEVSIAAKRGRTLIGRTRPQTLRAGRQKLVLPVRGKEPPTSLKLIARPARTAT